LESSIDPHAAKEVEDNDSDIFSMDGDVRTPEDGVAILEGDDGRSYSIRSVLEHEAELDRSSMASSAPFSSPSGSERSASTPKLEKGSRKVSHLVDDDGDRSPVLQPKIDGDWGDNDSMMSASTRRSAEGSPSALSAVRSAFAAARRNDAVQVSALLHQGLLHVDDRCENGTTLLHEAAKEGYEGLAQVLVRNHGADPNASDATGCTPCHVAMQFNHRSIVRTLCALGADDGILNANGLSCYEIMDDGPVARRLMSRL